MPKAAFHQPAPAGSLRRLLIPATLGWWAAAALLAPGSAGPLRAAEYDLSAASFLGGTGTADRVVAARVLSDGTLVLAANLSAGAAPGVAPLLLNGAGTNAAGAVVRLSADGRRVLSVTRLANQVNDLASDDRDQLYVAAHDLGVVKLTAAADALAWSRPAAAGQYAWRVDAGGAGYAVALSTGGADVTSSTPGAGTLDVYGPDGARLGSFAGYQNTLDVCLDPASATVVHCGWRQGNVPAAGGPVQISYVEGRAYDGTPRWLAYDWSTDPASPRYLNAPENNMADSRALRCSVGADGKLYVAFQVAGGNHLFRYDPFNVRQKVTIVGGDFWHEFYNTHAENKTFFARYEPATGAYLLGQQFTGRLLAAQNFRGNTVRPDGDIRADALGRVYLGGSAAYGLPLPPHPSYVPAAGAVAFNPEPPFTDASYLGGAWLLVMDADFTTRRYCTRLSSNGSTLALDARVLSGSPGGAANVVFAGQTQTAAETYTAAAVQGTWGSAAAPEGSATQGWFGVVAAVTGAPSATPTPTATPPPGPTPTPPRTPVPTPTPTPTPVPPSAPTPTPSLSPPVTPTPAPATPPVVSVVADRPRTSAGGGLPGRFTFTRSGGDPGQPLTVRLMVRGSAQPGVDYVPWPHPRKVIFPAGRTQRRLLVVPVDRHLTDGSVRTVKVVLPRVAGASYQLGTAAQAKVVIAEDGSR